MDLIEPGYLGLFFATMLAATIIPFSSEVMFAAMIHTGFDPWACLWVASAGNWAGGMISFAMGWVADWHRLNKWFRVREVEVNKWEHNIDRWGHWLALLCWTPFVGDLLAVALGFFRVDVKRTAVLMFIGKWVRYALILMVINETLY